MLDTLATIIATKRDEIIANKKMTPISKLQEMIAQQTNKIRDFVGAIRDKLAEQQPAIIAEIKKASPSQGIIRSDFDPEIIAKSYAKAGATCLSVLTDEQYFQGSRLHLQQARAACSLPILRKDFIVDPYQIYESSAIGADCILLIMKVLTDDQAEELSQVATELNLAVLLETHDEHELDRALNLSSPLIGINNRDLRTFKTDLNITLSLRHKIPADRILVTESGICTKDDVLLMRRNNVNTFLIGEAFMRVSDPGEKLQEIFS